MDRADDKKASKKFSPADRLKSFTFAFTGLKSLFSDEHNFRIHIVVLVLVWGSILWPRPTGWTCCYPTDFGLQWMKDFVLASGYDMNFHPDLRRRLTMNIRILEI